MDLPATRSSCVTRAAVARHGGDAPETGRASGAERVATPLQEMDTSPHIDCERKWRARRRRSHCAPIAAIGGVNDAPAEREADDSVCRSADAG